MNEFVGRLEERAENRITTKRARFVAIEALGPLTILAGVVWAIAQPYRLVFLRDTEKGLWDYLGQPPLLVVFVGLVFSLLIAPGLLEDMRRVENDDRKDDGTAS
ncbi:MAG: hypothetical protein FJW96_01705 [Actinobacteria bacterium]|nr:hypothetical protein [Actinomycetota bacterium]